MHDLSVTLTPWSTASSAPKLHDGETHVWAFDLDVTAARLEELQSLLAQDELTRASKFLSQRDRDRFVAARAQLRTILGSYVDRAPESLEFAYSQFGKPSFAPSMGMERFRFNASGSDGLAMVAVRFGAEVGVDVERFRSMPDALAVSKRFFTAEEYNALSSVPEELLLTHFFGYWTRKEAVVKSLGKGLSQALNRFTLVAQPGADVQRVTIEHEGANVPQWVVPLPALRDGFAAAVAAQAPINAVKCYVSNTLNASSTFPNGADT